MIKQLAHVCISSTNLEASEKFYVEGLKLSKVFNFLRDNKVIGFYFAAGGNNYIEVFEAGQVDNEAKLPIRHFCLQVDDLESVIAHVRGQGYEVSDKKLGADQSWQAWVTDPSGVRIEFHEYTEKSSQVTKADCVL